MSSPLNIGENELVKLNEWYNHAKFDTYRIYRVRENRNVNVFTRPGNRRGEDSEKRVMQCNPNVISSVFLYFLTDLWAITTPPPSPPPIHPSLFVGMLFLSNMYCFEPLMCGS